MKYVPAYIIISIQFIVIESYVRTQLAFLSLLTKLVQCPTSNTCESYVNQQLQFRLRHEHVEPVYTPTFNRYKMNKTTQAAEVL